MDVPDGETAVEIPDRMIQFFQLGNLDTVPEIRQVLENCSQAASAREAVHLEDARCLRDGDRTAVHGPWAAGEPDDLEWLQGWRGTLREHVRAGRSWFRRARVVSEPLSDYQRWSYSIAGRWWAGGYPVWCPCRWLAGQRRLTREARVPLYADLTVSQLGRALCAVRRSIRGLGYRYPGDVPTSARLRPAREDSGLGRAPTMTSPRTGTPASIQQAGPGAARQHRGPLHRYPPGLHIGPAML